MWEDPIVKEVRKARLEIEQECGGDFRSLPVPSISAMDFNKKAEAVFI